MKAPKYLAGLLGLTALLTAASPLSAAPVTGHLQRCASVNAQRNYCMAYVQGHVELVRQLSTAPCLYQESWGYDEGGIWVTHGCSGEFLVRATQDLSSVLPAESHNELAVMTVIARILDAGRAPNWATSFDKQIQLGVNYRYLAPPPVFTDWRKPEELPSLFQFRF